MLSVVLAETGDADGGPYPEHAAWLIEHRAEPSHSPIPVQLVANGAALAPTTEAAAPASRHSQGSEN